jgi:hypothetical protein
VVKGRYDALEDGDQFPEDFGCQVYTMIEKEGTYINSYNEPITSGDFSDVNPSGWPIGTLPCLVLRVSSVGERRVPAAWGMLVRGR